jgi:hypothetical protein
MLVEALTSITIADTVVNRDQEISGEPPVSLTLASTIIAIAAHPRAIAMTALVQFKTVDSLPKSNQTAEMPRMAAITPMPSSIQTNIIITKHLTVVDECSRTLFV